MDCRLARAGAPNQKHSASVQKADSIPRFENNLRPSDGEENARRKKKKMEEKTPENNPEELNAGIAKSREEIAALAAGLEKLAEGKIDKFFVDGKRPQEDPANGDKRNGGWTGFRHRLEEAGARGEKIAQGLADEIKRHPLLGGLAAFGLGFGIATLLFKRSKSDSRQGDSGRDLKGNVRRSFC